jgi:hypothetical protein
VHLSGDIMTGGLSAPSLSTNTLYVGASTIYFINSGGQVINYLNSQDVLNFRNNFLFTTANSGNWQSVYLTVNDLSSQWAIDLDNSEVNNFVFSNSATILNVDTVVQTNSATWNYQGADIKSLTANWQNTYTNFSTQSSNNTAVYTTVNSNSMLMLIHMISKLMRYLIRFLFGIAMVAYMRIFYVLFHQIIPGHIILEHNKLI